jgi:hypothetical protein
MMPDALVVVALLATQLPLIVLSFGSFLPISAGWYLTWAAEAQHKDVYRQFFFPLPPLALLVEGTIPRLFSDPIRAEQVLQSIKWLIIVALLYMLLRTVWGRLQAGVGTAFAAAAYFVQPFNIIAGYFELVWLFLILATLLLIRGLRPQGRSAPLFFGGAALSAALLVKQTAIFPVALVFLAAFMILFVVWPTSRPIYRFAILLSGFAVPLALTAGWAISQGSASAMVSDLLSGGGKQPKLVDVLNWGVTGTISGMAVWPWLLLLTLFILAKEKRGDQKSITVPKPLLVGAYLLVFAGLVYPNILGGTPIVTVGAVYLLILFLLFLVSSGGVDIDTFFKRKPRERSELERPRTWVSKILTSAVIVLLVIAAASALTVAASVDWIDQGSNLAQELSGVLQVGGAAFALLLLFMGVATEADLSVAIRRGTGIAATGKELQVALLLIGAMTVGWGIGNSFSGDLTLETWLVSLAAAIACAVGLAETLFSKRSATIILALVLAPLMFFFTARQIAQPYTWWGLAEPALTSPGVQPDVHALRNFRLQPQEAQFYDDLNAAVAKAQRTANGAATTGSFKNVPVFFAPNNAGLADVLKVNSISHNCPVLWWDVCPEDKLGADVKWVEATRPPVIVWNDPPEAVQQAHEADFRGGAHSAMRALQAWIYLNISDGSYELIQDFPLNATEPTLQWHMKVLARRPAA